MAVERRKDKKNRVLKEGEYQRSYKCSQQSGFYSEDADCSEGSQ